MYADLTKHSNFILGFLGFIGGNSRLSAADSFQSINTLAGELECFTTHARSR